MRPPAPASAPTRHICAVPEGDRETSDDAVARTPGPSDVPDSVRRIGPRRGADAPETPRSTLDDVNQTGSVWTDGLEPGRQVVVLGIASALTIVAIDVLLVGELSFFFDLCFIVLCLALALVVEPRDFYTVGVLPPLMMLAVFALLGAVAPAAIADQEDGLVQAVASGLAHHSGALVAGYAVCLTTLALRQRARSGATTPE